MHTALHKLHNSCTGFLLVSDYLSDLEVFYPKHSEAKTMDVSKTFS